MSQQFNRFARVDVGLQGGGGVRIEGLRVAFELVKTSLPRANELTVSIYNLSPSSRAQVEQIGARLVLSAGYTRDIIKTLAVGDVSSYETLTDGNGDRVTTLICGDGVRALRDTRIALSYMGGIAAQQIVTDISGAMALDSVDILADLSGGYRNGYSYSGQARGALDELASRFNFDWSIQNGELKILERRTADTRDVVVLTPQTGLIGSPAPLDDLGTAMAQNAQQAGLTVECQLQPRLYPASVVELRSRDYTGRYRIETVIHRGDTHGNDWRSELQVREL